MTNSKVQLVGGTEPRCYLARKRKWTVVEMYEVRNTPASRCVFLINVRSAMISNDVFNWRIQSFQIYNSAIWRDHGPYAREAKEIPSRLHESVSLTWCELGTQDPSTNVWQGLWGKVGLRENDANTDSSSNLSNEQVAHLYCNRGYCELFKIGRIIWK